MKASETPAKGYECLVGGGEMGALMRSYDWSKTPFGSVDQWPQSLRSALSICLNSRFPIAIYWGPDCLLLYNDAWRPIVGNKHPWSLGRAACEVWPEIWDNIGPEFAKVVTTGEGILHSDELLLMNRFGYTEECFFDYTFNPIQGEGGVIDGILNIVSETTYRVLNDRRAQLLREIASKTGTAKTVEEACVLMTEAFRSDPEDIPFSLLYLIDPEGRRAHLHSPEFASDSLPGSRLGDLIAPTVVDLEMADDTTDWPIAQVVRTAQPQEVKNLAARFGQIPGSPWREPPEEAMILPITSPRQGKLAGVLVAVASPRLRLDDAYRNFFNQVAAQVAVAIATANSYEEERRRAEQLAELDQAKTVFFSNVSHEFRTPLTLMLSPVEEALREAQDSEQRDRLELIHRNTLRLQKLVNTLLDFSRIEAGRIEAVYEPTDLATLTTDLAGVFRSAIERMGVRLQVDCPPLPEPVYVDREMWEKVVLNLLSNAFKFTFEGEIALVLRHCGDRVELKVQDTGTGISADELPRIFERFHRVRGAKGRSYEGSGIGLSLVEELVKLHGGAIQVSSVVDQGTCFTVSIPTGSSHLQSDRIRAPRVLTSSAIGAAPYVEEALRWLPEEADGRAQRVEERADEQGQRAEGETTLLPSASCFPPSKSRILLADDNADMRDYLKRLLSQQYDVEVVGDGGAVLSAIRRQAPDLLLTDVMMPGMDGFEVLRALRSNPTTQDIPVILLSARAGEESRIEGLEAGADDYLTKPFSARELMARVEANVKLAQLRREARQQEQTLRLEAETARQSLETILSSISDGFLALDRNWCYTYINNRACEIIGMQRDAVLGKNMWELFPDVVGTEVYGQFQQALDEQTAVQFEYFYPTWNRWFEYRVYPSPNGLTIFTADITNRKQAELDREQLLALESHYVDQLQGLTTAALAINSALSVEEVLQVIADQAAFTIGSHQCVISMTINQNWEQAINAIHLSDKYAQWRDYNEPPDGSGIYACVCHMNQPMRLTQAQLEVHPHWRNFGKAVADHPPMRGWLAAPLVGRDGQNIGLIQLSDKYEGEFTETDEAILMQLTQMAAVAVENARLYEAEQQARSAAEASREEAQAANRIKDEFLAVLSHELRSPLNPILGWSRLLQSTSLDEAKTKLALSTIERNAKLQSELIEDLLDVSRILQGKLSLTVSPVNLASTIRAAIETVRLAAEAKSIQLELELNSDVGLVSGDTTRLQQVVWNLLSNAVKFTPTGGRISVRLEQVDQQAQITVSDTGKGISAQFLPYVFDYFRQADGATTRQFGGLGLGLAIVRHLVELHGGTIRAESLGENLGATFTVRLPLMLTQSTTDQSSRLLELSLDLGGIQILVVDDDTDTRDFIAFLLEQFGANVSVAASANEAFTALTQSHPDVLVSDIGMPDMDGYMLIRQIRNLPPERGGQVPAIALTAYAGEMNQQQALQAGFQHHISKPVEPEELVQLIMRLVRDHNTTS
ncbi:MAG TPA: ATP-binding protein [Trichocoleus sp.]